MFKKQISIIKKYIDKMLKKKYIKLNTSLYAVFILIIKKFNEKLKFYMNYRILNIFIIFNKNVSFFIKKTLAKFCKIRIYNKFDIIIVFNKIRIKKNYEEKIIFFIKYNLYKYIIIFFKLYNIFVTFQIFINDVLRKYLNIFYITYFDDIFIYNNIKKKYIQYVNKMLKKFQ